MLMNAVNLPERLVVIRQPYSIQNAALDLLKVIPISLLAQIT